MYPAVNYIISNQRLIGECNVSIAVYKLNIAYYITRTLVLIFSIITNQRAVSTITEVYNWHNHHN